PYSVVLLDEIEKAHSDVFNVLLQVLDDGRLTDGQGRSVDFSNTVLIMTSNLGSQYIEPTSSDEQVREQVMVVVQSHFRPEFLNRVDEVIVFHRLTQEHLRQIVDIQLEHVRTRLATRRISLTLTEAAKDWLASEGYDPAYGARPLKRLIQTEIADKLALQILDGTFREDDAVQADVGEGGLVFRAA
ncbi:MAG: AAA family ATPase, partial [Acidimicrobiia bacterium]